MTLQILDPYNWLPLNILGDDTLQLLPLADDLVADPQTLVAHDGITVTPRLQAFHLDAIEALLVAEDDHGKVMHGLARAHSPAYNSFLTIVWM